MFQVEIIRFNEFKKGYMLGFVDVYIESMGLELYGCTFFKKNSNYWINFPSIRKENQDGSVTYETVFEMKDKKMSKTFSEVVTSAIRKHVSENAAAPAGSVCINTGIPF